MGVIDTLPRSEVEVVADALWRLVQRSVLSADQNTIRSATAAVGITLDDLRLASIRLDRRPFRPPREDRATTRTTIPDSPVTSRGGRGAARGRPLSSARETDGRIECFCSRCRRWKSQEEFGIKDHQTGRRKSMCRPCMSDYQRERYLSVEKAGHLAELRFRLNEGDAVVGDACDVCKEILEVGDEVLAKAKLVHATCGEGVHP